MLKHFLIHIVENHWSIIVITLINCYWQTAPSLFEHHQFVLVNIVVLSFWNLCQLLLGVPVLGNHDYVIALSQCPSVVVGLARRACK